MRKLFSNSLLSRFGRRYSDSLREAAVFVEQINTFKRVVPEWRRRVTRMDLDQIEAIQKAVNELRDELRGMSQEMGAAEGHLAEAADTGETLVNRLATGAHLSEPGNLAYLLEGDADGLAQYMEHAGPTTIKQMLGKISREKRVELLEALLKDSDYSEVV